MTTGFAKELSSAIILQAVMDWRFLIEYTNNFEKYKNMKHPPDYTFATIRTFFKSDWCLLLCESIDPKIILEKLEKERRQAVKVKANKKNKGVYYVELELCS